MNSVIGRENTLSANVSSSDSMTNTLKSGNGSAIIVNTYDIGIQTPSARNQAVMTIAIPAARLALRDLTGAV